jgi:hypothetical protein
MVISRDTTRGDCCYDQRFTPIKSPMFRYVGHDRILRQLMKPGVGVEKLTSGKCSEKTLR